MLKRVFSIALLLSAFSLPAFAGQSEDPGFGEDLYECWAKDYENRYVVGNAFPMFEDAQKSALQYCKLNSIAPETCRVAECTNLAFVKSSVK